MEQYASPHVFDPSRGPIFHPLMVLPCHNCRAKILKCWLLRGPIGKSIRITMQVVPKLGGPLDWLEY
ncbi:hypothetical protein CDAR_556111 [Caerostris darwini]|uniref:Uncharacterized protein n=1 Tax=Caerostris darwini TaxID=1538125 RepID=A0AAV4SUQ5_9ARAC|nr:hypothetical protein CDAR_556111 [Caerostris darwini]